MSKFFTSRTAAKADVSDKAALVKRNLEQEIEKEMAVMSISIPFLPKCQVRGLVLKKLGLQTGKTEKTLLRKGGARIDYNQISLDFPESQNVVRPTGMQHIPNIRKKLLGHSHSFRIDGHSDLVQNRQHVGTDDSFGFSQTTPPEQPPRPFERKTTRPPRQNPKRTLRRRLYSMFDDEREVQSTTIVEDRPPEEPQCAFHTSTPKKQTSAPRSEEDQVSWIQEAAAHVRPADQDALDDVSEKSHSAREDSFTEVPGIGENRLESSDDESEYLSRQPSPRAESMDENTDIEALQIGENRPESECLPRQPSRQVESMDENNTDTESSQIGENRAESSDNESDLPRQPSRQAGKDAPMEISQSTDKNNNSPMQAEDEEHASPVLQVKHGGYARSKRLRLSLAADKKTERNVAVSEQPTPVAVPAKDTPKSSLKESLPDKQSEEHYFSLSGVPRSASPVPGSVASFAEDQSFEIVETFECSQEPPVDTAVVPETPSDAASTTVTSPEKRAAQESSKNMSQRSSLSRHREVTVRSVEHLSASLFSSASQKRSTRNSAGSRRASPGAISTKRDSWSCKTLQDNEEVRQSSGKTSAGGFARADRSYGADESELAASPEVWSSFLPQSTSSVNRITASQEPPMVIIPRSMWDRRSPRKYISSEGASSGDTPWDSDQNEVVESSRSSGVETPTTSDQPYRGLSTRKGIPWIDQVPNQRITARRALFHGEIPSPSEKSETEKYPKSQDIFLSYEPTEICKSTPESRVGIGEETPQAQGHLSVDRLLLRTGADRLDGLPFPSGEAVRPNTTDWLHQKKLSSQSDSCNNPTEASDNSQGKKEDSQQLIHQEPPKSGRNVWVSIEELLRGTGNLQTQTSDSTKSYSGYDRLCEYDHATALPEGTSPRETPFWEKSSNRLSLSNSQPNSQDIFSSTEECLPATAPRKETSPKAAPWWEQNASNPPGQSAPETAQWWKQDVVMSALSQLGMEGVVETPIGVPETQSSPSEMSVSSQGSNVRESRVTPSPSQGFFGKRKFSM